MKKLFMYSVAIALSGKYVMDIDVVAGSQKAAKALAVARMQERNPNWQVTAQSAYQKKVVVA